MAAETAREVDELAREAAGWFATGERDDGSRYVYLKDEAPSWIGDLVYEAHGGLFLPDDWRYECIQDALYAIADGGDEDEHEFADRVDVYTGDLLAWVASNLNRPGYCDEAQSEGIAEEGIDVIRLITLGQYMERREVYGLTYRALVDHAETLEDEAGE
jgi:hypothetical protein